MGASFQSGPESVAGKYVHQEAVDVVCLTLVALVKGLAHPTQHRIGTAIHPVL